MISLHVTIMVLAVMLGLANVMKDSTGTVAQVNMIICYYLNSVFIYQFARFLAFDDQGPPHEC